MGTAPPIKVMVLAGSLGKGGTERVFSLLLEHFDRKRFAPELAIFDLPIAYTLPADVPVSVLSQRPAARSPIIPAVTHDLRDEQGDAVAWMGGAAAKLAELVEGRQPDVIVASPLWASIMALLALDRFPESTRLINIAGAPPTFWLSDHPQRELFGYLLKENLNRSDEVVAVSRAISQDLVANFCVDAGRIEVIHTPSNIASIQTRAQEPLEDTTLFGDVPTVVFVGRLEPVKGVEYLLRAVALVVEDTPLRLLLVGDGSQRGYLVALAKHLGIAEHVVFLGAQENPFKFMRQSTAFVLSSVSEGMPNVLMEAMTCGCPVIATDIEGGVTREVLEDGRCGLIVPREDPEALAQGIRELLGDSEARARYVAEGLRRCQEFDLPRIVSEFEDVIEKAASSTRPRSGSPARGSSGQPATRAETAPGGSRSLSAAARSGARGLVTSGIAFVRPAARAVRGIGRRLSAGAQTPIDRERLPKGVKRPLRLLILIPALTPDGPAETLAAYLVRAGSVVRLVSVGDDPVRARVPEGVEHAALLTARSQIEPSDIARPGLARRDDDLEWLAVMSSRVADTAAAWCADVILADGFEAGRLALISKRFLLPETPVLVRAAGRLRDTTAGFNGDLDSAVLSDYLGEARAIAVNTPALAEEVADAFEAAADRVLVIPSPIDREAALAESAEASSDARWNLSAEPTFVCAFEGDPNQALGWLFDAVSLAAPQSGLRVIVGGCGSAASRLERQAREAGVAEELVSFVPDAGPPPAAALGAAAGFIYAGVNSAASVPAPIVMAVAAGCPVISAKGSAPVEELLDGGAAGVLVRSGDARALAEAMLQLAWDHETAQAMASCASDQLGRMSAETVAAAFEELVRAPAPSVVP